jgi:hypothetical protein
MKRTFTFNKQHLSCWFLSGALAFLPACSFHQTPLTLLPVGPEPQTEFRETTSGYLVVYSAWDLANEYNALAMHHSAYNIKSEDGTMVKTVQNRNSSFDEAPERVALPPGSYKVMALAGHVGKIIVPVVIIRRETTFVYLDTYNVPEELRNHPKNVVTLPDGKIVGWLANVPHGGEF